MTILFSFNIPDKLLNYLNYFVIDFENIYGKHMISHNIHDLTHMYLLRL